MQIKFFEVAVNAPLRKTFTYKLLTDADDKQLYTGHLVKVPFGKRMTEGVIINSALIPEDSDKIKEISELNTEVAPLSPLFLKWLRWVSEYYFYPLGQTLQNVFPPLKREGKSRKKAILPIVEKKDFVELTDEQKKIVHEIDKLGSSKPHLIYGVTGSGKTEVYLEIIKKTAEKGGQTLLLVPEISLTPQLIKRFVERFGDNVAVLHSQLTQREKTDQWWSIVENKKNILIGARSALFCPFPNLKLIVVDEEHESSFKQDEKLKYNARDSAIVLAQLYKIPILLGSATPSLESWKNAQDHKYHLHKLFSRYSKGDFSKIHIVDLKNCNRIEGHPKWLSSTLYEKIQERLDLGEQSALFLNRRGLSQVVMCKSCGHVSTCPNCDVSLSLHAKNHLVCHYCNYSETLPELCSSCKQDEPQAIGLGTEKVEKDIKKIFPHARTMRLDRDEINNRVSLENAISDIESEKVDIIVGTQMISKGLDFPKLTLLGVVLADIGLSLPDFRSSEKSFQLLTQVSGRPGRHSKNGEVVIQTYNPEHNSIISSSKLDFEGFAKEELESRKTLSYPPFGRLGLIKIQGSNISKVKSFIKDVEAFSQKISLSWKSLSVLGPAPAPIFKLKNKYRFVLMIKSSDSRLIRDFFSQLVSKCKVPGGVKVSLDIDPGSTF